MDITTVFETVIPGSNPGVGTPRPPSSKKIKNLYSIEIEICGYGLVVECVLAKDETGVRFSLPAQLKKALLRAFFNCAGRARRLRVLRGVVNFTQPCCGNLTT